MRMYFQKHKAKKRIPMWKGRNFYHFTKPLMTEYEIGRCYDDVRLNKLRYILFCSNEIISSLSWWLSSRKLFCGIIPRVRENVNEVFHDKTLNKL